MKQLFKVLTFLNSILTLTACSYSTNNVDPNKKYKALKNAFDVIESSLTKPVFKDETLKATQKNWYHPYNFDKIFELYTDEDICEENPEIGYNTFSIPQFMFIKDFYDNYGKDFSFNSRYSQSLTGSKYINFDIGQEVESDENYKYNYLYDMSLSIGFIYPEAGETYGVSVAAGNISSNFNVKAVYKNNNGDEVKTSFTTFTVINYKFDLEQPNFSLYTVNIISSEKNDHIKELDADYLYDYEYVDIEDGILKEWRNYSFFSDTYLFDIDKQEESSPIASYEKSKESGIKLTSKSTESYRKEVLYRFKDFTEDKEDIFYDQLYKFLNSQRMFLSIYSQQAISLTDKIENSFSTINNIIGFEPIFAISSKLFA